MGPHSEGVNRGTILTILNRAIQNGLVTTNRLDGAKKPYLFELTEGGRRRTRWIRSATKQRLPKLRAVANPQKNGEEE